MDPWSDALLDLPAGIPPEGHTPDFSSPSPAFQLSITLLTIAIVISTATVIVRCYTIFVKRKLQAPDILLILAWMLLIPYSVFIMLGVVYGVGKHQYDIHVRDGVSILYVIQNATIMYIILACFLKIAILLQYFHIFVVVKKKALGIIIWTTISIIAAFTVTILGFLIWQCNPRAKIWNPFVPGSCYSWQIIVEASGVFNVISDFAVLLIPISPVCRLKMSAKKKIQIISIFAIGFLDCLASVGRTYYTWVVKGSTDQTSVLVYVGYWAGAEITFGFVVACLPTSTLFVKTLRQKFSKSKHSVWEISAMPSQPRRTFSSEANLTDPDLEFAEIDILCGWKSGSIEFDKLESG